MLKKAWQITWQNKFLWLFGLLTALIGNGSIYEILVRGFTKIGETSLALEHITWTRIFLLLTDIKEFLAENQLAMFFFSLLLFSCLALFVLVIWLAIVARGALLASIAKINKKEKINLSEGWALGKKFFWQILGINILARSLIFAFLLVITIPTLLFLKETSGAMWQNLLLYLLTFVLFIALALIISLLNIYASAFVVIKNCKFFEAIQKSWNLFVKNWLVSLEMGLILFLISFCAGLLFLILSGLLAIPFILLFVAFYYLNFQSALIVISLFAILAWLCLLILTGAFLSAFQFSSWTLLFINLNKKKIFSKLMRFVGIKK